MGRLLQGHLGTRAQALGVGQGEGSNLGNEHRRHQAKVGKKMDIAADNKARLPGWLFVAMPLLGPSEPYRDLLEA